jgi:putative peptidoglycan lipid II flippase
MASITQIERIPTRESINRSIFRAAASVAAVGILVKAIATFKEVALAGVYGRSDAMDAFLMAAMIPGLLINLISESMNQALVPTLIRVREQEGRDQAQRLLSSSMLWMCVLLGLACAAMALTAHGFFPLIVCFRQGCVTPSESDC